MTQKVFITGTSSGIGKKSLEMFYEKGYAVTATVRKEKDRANLLKSMPDINCLIVDLNYPEQIENVIKTWFENNNGADILINNAGYMAHGPVEESPLEDYRKQMETNFFSVVNLTKLAIPYMRKRKSGRIIQVSSGFGRFSAPILSAYCASKFAVEGFSESLRLELLPFNVYVSLIEPGPVMTNFNQNIDKAVSDLSEESPYKTMHELALKMENDTEKVASSAEDVAKVILKAATTAKPKLRYEVGIGGLSANLANKFLPQELLEWGIKGLLK